VVNGRIALGRPSPAMEWGGLLLLTAALLAATGKLIVFAGPYALLVPLLIPLTAAALTRPAFAVYALAFLSPLTSGMGRGSVIPFFRPNELVLMALVYVAVVTFLARKRPFRFTWLDGLVLAFLAFRVGLPTAVFFFRGEPWSAFAFKTLFGPLQYYIVFRMGIECIEDGRQARTAIFLMLVSSSIVAFVGVLQALQVPGINAFLETYYPSDKDIYTFLFARRVTSLWAGDWNGCGLYMAMCTVLALGTAHLFLRRWQRMLVLGIAFLDLVVVFLTASFTGTICLFLGLALLFARSSEAKRVVKPLLLVAPVIGVVLGGVFWKIISERIDVQFNQAATTLVPHSFRIRIWMWRELMWPWVERFWLWGLGPYRWGWPDEESYYMFTILKAGFFGMLAYAALHLVLFFRLPAIFRRARTWRGAVALVVWIHFLQVAIANISGSYFEANGVSEILWLLAGFLMASEVRGGAMREAQMSAGDLREVEA
jgi:hypothetical protein